MKLFRSFILFREIFLSSLNIHPSFSDRTTEVKMHPIKLIEFSDKSKIIPTHLLSDLKIEKKISPWKLIMSCWIDFGLAIFVTLSLMVIFSQYVDFFISGLSLEMNQNLSTPSLFLSFSSIFIFYSFTSFYFNNGQSLGFYITKNRLAMDERSLMSSLTWSLKYFSISLTGGLASTLFKLPQNLVTHDYLYQKLMTKRNFKHLDLVLETTKMEEQEEATPLRNAA